MAASKEFTNREMRQVCARGMGIEFTDDYNPLTKDEQADALAERFNLQLEADPVVRNTMHNTDTTFHGMWRATVHNKRQSPELYEFFQSAIEPTRNRAIVVIVTLYVWGGGKHEYTGG